MLLLPITPYDSYLTILSIVRTDRPAVQTGRSREQTRSSCKMANVSPRSQAEPGADRAPTITPRSGRIQSTPGEVVLQRNLRTNVAVLHVVFTKRHCGRRMYWASNASRIPGDVPPRLTSTDGKSLVRHFDAVHLWQERTSLAQDASPDPSEALPRGSPPRPGCPLYLGAQPAAHSCAPEASP